MKYTHIFGLFLLFYISIACSEELSAQLVLTEIAKSGPNSVIQKYYDKHEWQVIMKGIATADDQWLKVYVELEKGADGAAGEDLSAVLWDSAVLHAPFRVFAIEHYDSCEFTFEDECPPGGVESYLRQLEKALEKASTREQKVMKKHCLAGIKNTRAVFSNPKAYCPL